MKCKLCLKQVDKLCDSHIISELFYKPIYDEPHRYTVISEDPKTKNCYKQKGIKEKLLCLACEKTLCDYEKYVNDEVLSFIKKINPVKFKIKTLNKKFNYKELKLFQLSILWRASISTHEMFSSVKLGCYEEKIRKMILEGDPGKYYDFGCFMGIVKMGAKIGDNVIFSPIKNKYQGYTRYYFIFGGIYWIYIVSNKSKKFQFKQYYLQEDGCLTLSIMDIVKMRSVVEFSDTVYSQGKMQVEE